MFDNDQEILESLLPDHARNGRVGRVAVSEKEFVDILGPAYAAYKTDIYLAARERNQPYQPMGEYLTIDKDSRTALSESNQNGHIIRFKLAWASENPETPSTVFAWTIYEHVLPAWIPPLGREDVPQKVNAQFNLPPFLRNLSFSSFLFRVALPFIKSNVLTSVQLLDWIILNTEKTAAKLSLEDYFTIRDGERIYLRQFRAMFNVGSENVNGILSKAAERAGCTEYSLYGSSGIAVAMHPSSIDVALMIRWSATDSNPKSTFLSFFIYKLDPDLNSALEKLASNSSQEKSSEALAAPDRHMLDSAYRQATSWVRTFIGFLRLYVERSIIIPQEADRLLIEKLMPEHSDHAFIEKFPIDEEQFLELLKTFFNKNILKSGRMGSDRAELIIDDNRRSAEITLYIARDPNGPRVKVAKLSLRWTSEEREKVAAAVVWASYEYLTEDISRPAEPSSISYQNATTYLVKNQLFGPISDSIRRTTSQQRILRIIENKEELWRFISEFSEKSSGEEVKVDAGRIPEVLRFMGRVEEKSVIIYDDTMIAAIIQSSNVILLKWQPGPITNGTTLLRCINYRTLQGEVGGKYDRDIEKFINDIKELILRLPSTSLDSTY
jgi:hypothetical protein